MELTVFVPKDAGQIERNAARMIVDEIAGKCGSGVALADWPVSGGSLKALAVGGVGSFSPETAAEVLAALKPDGEEGFEIRTADDSTIVLAGNTGSGVLYAACHLLHSIEYADSAPVLPDLSTADSPDCEIRGCSFASHGHGGFAEHPEEMEGMKSLIRFYARNRVNLITVEATGKRWPGDLSPTVTWKHFPQLQEPARDEMVSKRREMINDLISYAHSWGVKVVLYTSEFNHEPDVYDKCPELHGVLPETWSEGRHNYVRGCMCLSKEIVWQYLRAKVVEALEALPELDGLELWMAEVPSEFGICACPNCRSKPRHEWIERLIGAARSAMDEVAPSMPLYVKTFQSSQGALEVERFSPLKGKLPHDTIISCKGQFGDMAYLNDPHPLLGWIQDGGEVAEFDVGGEYRGCGLGAMICCIPEYLAERFRLYYSKGVRRFLARHAVPTWPNKEFVEINDVAFYKLAWDIDADIERTWRDWATERFGPAAEPMVELLKLSDEVVSKSIYVLGACANRHYYLFSDNLDSLKYMMFDLSAFMIEGGVERLEPTPENIETIIAEKDEAIQACARMMAAYERAAPLLPEEVAATLGATMRRTERIVAVMRPVTEAVFTYFRWERSWSIRERDLLRGKILRMLNDCEAEIDAAANLPEEQWQGRTFWNLRKVVDFERARRLCEEVRGLINFSIGQKADYTVTVTPSTVGHPNTYADHRRELRSIFGLPGDG